MEREYNYAGDYETLDINYASFLHSRGVVLLDIKPVHESRSRFCFEQPPEELIELWQEGDDPSIRIIYSYRQLMREAVAKQKRLASLVGGI